jgi:hypothetical protein
VTSFLVRAKDLGGFPNPATSPAVCLLAGYFALAAEPGDLFPLISEENVLREREKLRAGQRKSR